MENRVRRALVSVYDKTGLESFVRLLVQREIEVLSTGGTYKALRAAGIAVREVSELGLRPASHAKLMRDNALRIFKKIPRKRSRR